MPIPDREERLAETFQKLLEQVEQGRTLNWVEITASYPDLAAELQDLVGAAQLAQALGGSGSSLDPLIVAESGSATTSNSFGDYEELIEIGRGGMGVVYKARQKSLNRDVALKMMVRGSFATPDDLRRFRVEAESAAKLTHPHIVPVYEVGDRGGLPYFSMQLVEGETLAQRISRSPLSPREAAALLIPVCRGIAHAHAAACCIET